MCVHCVLTNYKIIPEQKPNIPLFFHDIRNEKEKTSNHEFGMAVLRSYIITNSDTSQCLQ